MRPIRLPAQLWCTAHVVPNEEGVVLPAQWCVWSPTLATGPTTWAAPTRAAAASDHTLPQKHAASAI